MTQIINTPVTGTFTSGTGISYTAETGTNRAVVLILTQSSSSGQGTPLYTGFQPTYGGVNMVQAGSFINNSASRYMIVSMWYVLEANIPTGAQTMVASWNDTTNHLNEANAQAAIYTLSDVNQTTPCTATDSGTTNSATSISGSGLATTTGGIVLLGCAFNAGSNTGITPTNYTRDFLTSFDFSGFGMMCHFFPQAITTETPVVSWTGAGTAAILTANFQPVTSITPTPTITPTVTATPTFTPTNTITPTNTNTPTFTPTQNPIAAAFQNNAFQNNAFQVNSVPTSPTPTPTNTPTTTATNTITPTVTATNSITPTITATVTATNTVTPTSTPTITPTNTPTDTVTPTVTPSNTITAT